MTCVELKTENDLSTSENKSGIRYETCLPY